MGPYRDPDAAIYVGQMIYTHLNKSQLSREELALRLGASDAKIVNLMTGRHYFPLELAKPTAEALSIDEGELVYFTLLQYFPKEAVDFAWGAIGAYTLSRQKPLEEEPNDEGRKRQKKKKKRKRKRKRSR